MTWSPGFRRVPPGVAKKVGDHMLALLNAHRQTIRLMCNPPVSVASDLEDDTPVEPGDNIVISFENGYKKYGMLLTNFTTEELNNLELMFKLAIDTARPIVVERDRIAKEAADNGNDIFYRRHRGAPKLSVFQRAVDKYRESLPNRSEDVLGGDGPGHDLDPGDRDTGGTVAERPTENSLGEDDRPQTHQHEKLRARIQGSNPS